jgi:HSP20 family protein
MTVLKLNNPTHRSFNGLLDDIINDLPTAFGKSFRENVLTPMVNIRETKEGYDLELVAPGRNKEDFKINLEKNILTISSEVATNENKDESKQVRKEFSLQPFKRSFTVDDKIANEKISARYENGILKVMLPKNEEIKATVKEISVS